MTPEEIVIATVLAAAERGDVSLPGITWPEDDCEPDPATPAYDESGFEVEEW